MAELPHMPLATDAYLGDTRHLSTLEHGAYLLLLITAWRVRGRPQLPNDPKILARCAGVDPRTWQKIAPTIMAFWSLGDDGFWTQAKQLRVRDVVNKNAEAQRNKAAKRWSRKPLEDNEAADAAASAGDMPGECQPNPNPSIPPVAPKGRKRAEGYGDPKNPLYADFATNVWAKRWKRQGQAPLEAFQAYSKLTPAERVSCKGSIDSAARRYTESVKDEKFRPHLVRWIRNHGWEADTGTPAAVAEPDWSSWVTAYRDDPANWSPALGPKPGQPGCRAPRELLVGIVAA